MKKKTIGMIVGSTALLSAGTAVAIKSARKKADSGANGNLDMMKEMRNGADEAIQRAKTTMNKQEEEKAENEHTDTAAQNDQDQPSNSNAHHGDMSPEDLRRKEELPSPDADEVDAEKGLDMLDHQHRAEWQANVFPATEEEVEAIEEAERGKTGKTQSEQARELEKQHQTQTQKQNRNKNRNRNRNRNRKQNQNQTQN